MTTVRIIPRLNSKATHFTIYIRCTIKCRKVEVNTGVFIPRENWSETISRVMPRATISKGVADQLNKDIGDCYCRMTEALNQLTKSSTKEDLLKLLKPTEDKPTGVIVKKEYSLLDICRIVIDHSSGDNPRRYTKKGGKISSGTIKQYQNTLNTLMEFEKKGKRNLFDWGYINSDLYIDLKNYLYSKKQLDSSIDKVIKNLKSFLQYIYDEEVIEIPRVNLKKWKRINVNDQTVVYLLNDEFNILQQMPILEPHLDRTRDLFCFQTDNCLRISDLIKIRRYHFNHDFTKLDITHEKTDADTKLLQTDYSMSVIDKYKNVLPQGYVIPNNITEQVYNRQLKQVIKLLAEYIEQLRGKGLLNSLTSVIENSNKLLVRNLTVQVPFVTTVRQKKITTYDFLYNKISNHDARSTFITCMLIRGEESELIKKRSGHAPNSPAFRRYFDISDDVMNEFVVPKQNKMYKRLNLPPIEILQK